MLTAVITDGQRRLTETATAYGDGLIPMSELLTIRKRIEARMNDAKRQLERTNGDHTLIALVGTGHELRRAWGDLEPDPTSRHRQGRHGPRRHRARGPRIPNHGPEAG